MASKIGERIDRVIDLRLTPLLTEAGFQKERKTFRRAAGEQSQIVNIRSGKYNYGGRGEFVVNFGVFFPKFYEFWGGQEIKRRPGPQDCQLFRQLHQLMPSRTIAWWENFWGTTDETSDDHLMPSRTNTWAENTCWKLRENSDDDALAAGLAEAVGDYGLPWLEMCGEPAQARDYLESTAQAYLSKRAIFEVERLLQFEIVYFGEDKARATLTRLIESSYKGWLFKRLDFTGWLYDLPTNTEIRDYLADKGRELGLL